MNDTIGVTPEVDAFVAAVRACFGDLDPDEREDLLDGLEADMSDLVAERGPEALGDPGAYADELRAAAGLPAAGSVKQARRPVGTSVESVLDGAHRRWVDLVSGLPGDPWGFAQSLRPAWWVLRAWVALQLVDLIWGGGGYNLGLSPVPSLGPFGVPLLIVAVVGSVQLGRGKVWPARPGSGVGGRALLLVLNVVAIAVTPAVMTSLFTPEKAEAWGMGHAQAEPVAPRGLSYDGEPVTNIYPYDAAGNPLVGVQLLDPEGRRLKVDPKVPGRADRVASPWLQGSIPMFNVFPLAERTRIFNSEYGSGDSFLRPPPFAGRREVTLDGVTPTETVPPKARNSVEKPGVKKEPRR